MKKEQLLNEIESALSTIEWEGDPDKFMSNGEVAAKNALLEVREYLEKQKTNHPNRSTSQKTYVAIARPAGKAYLELYRSKVLDAVEGAAEQYAKKHKGEIVTLEYQVDGHPGFYKEIGQVYFN